MALTKTNHKPTAPPKTLEEYQEWVDSLYAAGANLQPLLHGLLKEKFQLQEALDEVRLHQEELREEMAALCAPPQYPAIITSVAVNGQTTVEVAAGEARLHVAVHPEVRREELRVGARGLLSHERNCLLRVCGPDSDWFDVGAFENYLPGGRRMLLKYQEQLIAVSATEDLLDSELRKGDLIGFDRGSSRLAHRKIDPTGKEDLFFEHTPADRFEELGGLDAEIARLQWVVRFRLQHEQLAARYKLKAKRGILLEGPPGNGKTKLARCLARFVADLTPSGECRFMAVAGSADYSMWLGQSEQRLIARFDTARELATRGGVPVVLFFDEIDAIGRRRGGDLGSSAPDRILATFLSQLDGMQAIANVIVLGATNRADVLDPGLIRPGRLGDVKIRIPAPNRSAAQAILHRYLGDDMPLSADARQLVGVLLSRIYSERGEYAELARVSLRDGSKVMVRGRDLVSGAMLENVVRVAAEQAADREARIGVGGISEDDVTQALDRELRGVARLLTPANVRGYVMRLPQDIDPVAVEVLNRGPSLAN
ncbi:MAG: AAA family ATPase, partial [Gemmataceae bacterium]